MNPIIRKALDHAQIDIGATIIMIEAAGNGDTCYGLRQTLGLIEAAKAPKIPDARCDECDNGLEKDWKYCPYCGHANLPSPSDDAEFGTKP